ncbi:chaperonin 10-like protein [Phaeosphaeria sp. MPI-PUGE-AT-0046c]|nr:chaperonin 10-like protein [Phaeosphaeria sp. MPI-PUGE-AT-0046c]
MSHPTTYAAYRRTTGDLPNFIEPCKEALPKELGKHDVLIKIHAVSLNYRDVGILIGNYPAPTKEGGIPTSDAAGEVVGMGSDVSTFAIGDRVAPITGVGKYEGRDDSDAAPLGTAADGVLGEYGVFNYRHLVHLPKHMSWEEGSMLPCAALTAWTALDGLAHVPEKASALFQGTGGVSVMALLISVAAGIKPIITSSSDEKLSSLQKLHPEVCGLNYKTVTDQSAEVKRLTDGRGVDFVINNTGPQSLIEDIGLLCDSRGTVSIVGFLQGFNADWDPKSIMTLMTKGAKVKGIQVGSKAEFLAMNRFLEEKKVRFTPALDRVFKFGDSKEAFDYLRSGKHTGKVVIKLE